jgi:hypothetical protein
LKYLKWQSTLIASHYIITLENFKESINKDLDQILSDNQIPKDGCFAMKSIVPMTEPIFASIIIAIISLVIIWAIVSVPVWISAKIITSCRARFGRVMLVTAAGPIVYALVLIISTSFLSRYWKSFVTNSVDRTSSSIFGLDLCI